ncbi:anti-sigma factor [Streptomyces sp. NPDC056661]|uniref:anti-sigma factor n=1 Tax=Streptomyces sp. NPDC056661 TaxID=3345898 RepID=UPI003690368A
MGKDRNIRHLHGVSADEEVRFPSSIIDDMLRQEAVWADLPPHIEDKVMRELFGDVRDVVPLRRRPRRLGALPRRRLVLVAASVALLGLAVGVSTEVLGGGQDDGRHVELAGSPLASGSHAGVVLRDTPSGVEIKLDLQGLPPAPVGSYYEGWVKGDLGMVAIGTFHLRQGTNNVILWSGVEIDDYPKISVTLQEEGHGPASSGKVMLSGHVPEDQG